MPINPTGADLKRFLTEDPGGPVVMLNLLQFTEGGRDSYRDYAVAVQPHLEKVGARLVYAGDCTSPLVAPEAHDWDTVLLVWYPSRQAFSAMVADPDYQEVAKLRSSSLTKAVLQGTTPWKRAALDT